MISYKDFEKIIKIISDRDIAEDNLSNGLGIEVYESPIFNHFWAILELYLNTILTEKQNELFFDYVYSHYDNFTELYNAEEIIDFYEYLKENE